MKEQELNLIRKIAWSFYKTNYSLEFDDLFSEACISYLEGEKQFVPNGRTKKSTFLWTVMKHHLTDYVFKETKILRGELLGAVYDVEEGEISNNLDCLTSTYKSPIEQIIENQEWEEIKNRMSPEARAILHLILTDQSLYLQTDKPKICRGLIKQKLRASGWKWQTIWDGFKELRMYAIL